MQRNPEFYIPSIVERKGDNIGTYDLLSRLFEDRIIVLAEQVNNASSISTVTMMMYLAAKDPSRPIKLYINSPGGSIIDGLMIIDFMETIKCPVETYCVGMAASMGAVILACGTKGSRFILPHSEVMIHQASGGAEGKTEDILVAARHITRLENTIYKILSDKCGKTVEEITAAARVDNWFTAEDAIKFGLVDKIVQTSKETK